MLRLPLAELRASYSVQVKNPETEPPSSKVPVTVQTIDVVAFAEPLNSQQVPPITAATKHAVKNDLGFISYSKPKVAKFSKSICEQDRCQVKGDKAEIPGFARFRDRSCDTNPQRTMSKSKLR
jgi:hypothetical protein